MKQSFLLAFVSIVTWIACSGPKGDPAADVHLKNDERELCAKQHIDTSLILLLRETFRGKLNEFAPDSIYTFDADENWLARASTLQGIMFEAPSGTAATLCNEYGEAFIAKGHTMYIFEQNFGYDYEKDKVAIVNTADKYEILRETATDGINYDINNDSVISIITTLDAKYDLTLNGCGLDWCQFTIGKAPSNWDVMAKEVYEICPDVVDQGTGTVQDLALELEQFGILYLWWD